MNEVDPYTSEPFKYEENTNITNSSNLVHHGLHKHSNPW